jgi:hypothetical protein
MAYFTYPQVICRKCGTSARATRNECPVCGSDLIRWKGVPLPSQQPASPAGDLSDRASAVRSRAAKKGICTICLNSFPSEELSQMEDGSKICKTCQEAMEKKHKASGKPDAGKGGKSGH